jgi:5-methylcytosine-specific restriction endonuclease McrA
MAQDFGLDNDRRPLSPVHPGTTRRWLTPGKVTLLRRSPFTLIRNEAAPARPVEPLRVKVDPGSQTTGLAAVNASSGQVVWAAELAHRGQASRNARSDRRTVRRQRRQRKTRYRAARFDNRCRRAGWLPPSVESRVPHIWTRVCRLQRLCPVGPISLELVRFDTQMLEHPDITRVAYQQGTLAGYEVRQFLLEEWELRCASCHQTGVPLQVEHLVPRDRGGSQLLSNLTLACEPCNLQKGARARQQRRVQGFLTGDLVRAVRTTGRLYVTTSAGTIQGIAATSCRTLQHRDGYSYAKGAGDFLPFP